MFLVVALGRPPRLANVAAVLVVASRDDDIDVVVLVTGDMAIGFPGRLFGQLHMTLGAIRGPHHRDILRLGDGSQQPSP